MPYCDQYPVENVRIVKICGDIQPRSFQISCYIKINNLNEQVKIVIKWNIIQITIKQIKLG